MNCNVHVDQFNFRLSIEMEKNARLGLRRLDIITSPRSLRNAIRKTNDE